MEKELNNSLGDLVSSIAGHAWQNGGVQLSQTDTLFINNRNYLISNFRQLLSELYVEHGIVQTLVDQPVDDSFGSGFEIKTGQLDTDEIEELMVFCERNQIIQTVMQAIKWGRLFGGGAVLIMTDQKADTPLDIKAIRPDSPFELRAVDLWELYSTEQNVNSNTDVGGALGAMSGDYYNYYGYRIHKSRVMRFEGKQAPSFVRPRLRGWGMSEMERVVRSINQYMKNQDVIFELLDEAKVDVYKMKGFNTALLSAGGTTGVARRIQHANAIKNYVNAITMDKDDEYEQKQVSFTGLAEVLTQIRQGIAADLKMPMTKLFGISAAGFNSGEDDIENYNSMLKGEIQSKVKFIVVDVLALCCQKVFGFVPDDLSISFNSLRILSSKEEEEVKDKQFNRTISAFTSGLATAQEAKEAINRDSLLPVEIDETTDALPPISGDFTVKESGDGGKADGEAPEK